MDASDTHVWGAQSDELGVRYVARRRLVFPAGQANEDGGTSTGPDISLRLWFRELAKPGSPAPGRPRKRFAFRVRLLVS